MGIDEIKVFRNYISKVKEAATEHANSTHLATNVRDTIKDLLSIVEKTEGFVGADEGISGADSRVLKGRYEKAKSELNSANKTIEKLKNCIPEIIEDVKIIMSEMQKLELRYKDNPVEKTTAEVVKDSSKRIVGKLSKI